MAQLEVTGREFRDTQKAIFDLTDRCEKALRATMSGDDLQLSPAMVEKIEHGLQNIKDGKTKRYTMEELRVKMGL